jgi:hypothetical protein
MATAMRQRSQAHCLAAEKRTASAARFDEAVGRRIQDWAAEPGVDAAWLRAELSLDEELVA